MKAIVLICSILVLMVGVMSQTLATGSGLPAGTYSSQVTMDPVTFVVGSNTSAHSLSFLCLPSCSSVTSNSVVVVSSKSIIASLKSTGVQHCSLPDVEFIYVNYTVNGPNIHGDLIVYYQGLNYTMGPSCATIDTTSNNIIFQLIGDTCPSLSTNSPNCTVTSSGNSLATSVIGLAHLTTTEVPPSTTVEPTTSTATAPSTPTASHSTTKVAVTTKTNDSNSKSNMLPVLIAVALLLVVISNLFHN
jgi:hypothetical protein